MKERNKTTKSFIARSVEEIEKEAFNEGYKAGFTKACEKLHCFAKTVYEMREAQRELDTCSIGDYGFRQHCAAQLESKVDEYLKKMEE